MPDNIVRGLSFFHFSTLPNLPVRRSTVPGMLTNQFITAATLKCSDMRRIITVAVLITCYSFTISAQTLGNIFNAPLRGPYDSAQKAYTNGYYQTAIKLYTEVINKADSTSGFEANIRRKAFIYRSFCKKELKDYAGSIEDMNTAILLDPKDLASYIDRGTTYLEMEDFKNAKEDFLMIIKSDKKSEQAKGAYYYLGVISYHQSEIEKGIAYLTKALEIDPNDIEILFARGYYFSLTLDGKKAIKDYDKVIKLDPSIKEAYANRGTEKVNLYNREGKKDQKLLSSACMDLKKAKALGDDAVDDLIFIYCK